MNISVSTKLYAVIGEPISQSLSPTLHNQLFEKYKIDGIYFPIEVQSKNLKELIAGFHLLNFGGFNITKPHKETIIKYLDEIDPLAKKIKAVNTVVCISGKMIGYNTDGYGFIKSIESITLKKPKQSLKVLILGSGGAVKSVSMALADWGIKKIFIANRTNKKAEDLSAQINENWPEKAKTIPLEESSLASVCEKVDIIINGTSLGMSDHIDQTPLDKNFFKPGLLAYDMIYSPSQTLFLKSAKEMGAQTQNGLDMLLYQGLLAFELWTGTFPDPKLGKEILLRGKIDEKK